MRKKRPYSQPFPFLLLPVNMVFSHTPVLFVRDRRTNGTIGPLRILYIFHSEQTCASRLIPCAVTHRQVLPFFSLSVKHHLSPLSLSLPFSCPLFFSLSIFSSLSLTHWEMHKPCMHTHHKEKEVSYLGAKLPPSASDKKLSHPAGAKSRPAFNRRRMDPLME